MTEEEMLIEIERRGKKQMNIFFKVIILLLISTMVYH